ncbi:MAG: hypothetical protein KGI63_09270, partial [Xanthomonadaceae bacterium]|nr:hypothetical protein [Xanthomonadaceae bacterium]
MHEHTPTPDVLHTHLLRALDWVQRSGWPTRDDDTTLAMQVFDFRSASALLHSDSTTPDNRDALAEELQAVFISRHGAEAACHLTTIFGLSLVLHLRTRSPGPEDCGCVRRMPRSKSTYRLATPARSLSSFLDFHHDVGTWL